MPANALPEPNCCWNRRRSLHHTPSSATFATGTRQPPRARWTSSPSLQVPKQTTRWCSTCAQAQHSFERDLSSPVAHSSVTACRAEPLQSREPTENEEAAAEDNTGSLLLTIGKWTLSLMLVIGIFYSVVFYASGGIAYFLKDKVTFTRKDFVPYSERRRLEEDQQSAQSSQQQEEALPGQNGLLDLLPTPPLKGS